MKAGKKMTLMDLEEDVMELPTSRSAIQPPSAHIQITKAPLIVDHKGSSYRREELGP